jgi:hypothetical protein
MCGAMEADPFEQLFEQLEPYYNLDQYLIWLASRDPAAVLRATDRPNSGANPPIGWRMHREPNVDRQKVEMEALRAIKSGDVKARVEFNAKWSTPDDPEWFADCVIEFEGEPTFAALLVRSTKHGGREKVRPRFNPRSIARLYPAPTPSNIRDRPDVENPVVGPFIAYFDAWYWLAERISLEESLPIDEAESRAEATIRYICMNTPEKLTMWGVRNTDPYAEPKRVTPQAWQALSINPLPGHHVDDGWVSEGGAVGKDGAVIWTDLRFDRKRFVAATHTPAARPAQPGERIPRAQPARERAQRALDELYPNGVPDHISKSDAELVSAVNLQIRKRGHQGVSRDTILRAAGRRN